MLSRHKGYGSKVDLATASEAGATFEKEPVRDFHIHQLPRKQGPNVVFNRNVKMANSVKHLAYPKHWSQIKTSWRVWVTSSQAFLYLILSSYAAPYNRFGIKVAAGSQLQCTGDHVIVVENLQMVAKSSRHGAELSRRLETGS